MLKWTVPRQELKMAAPPPRLCHLKKWAHFNGYGFNLHTDKNKNGGQLVGKIDPGSPAEAAGIKEGDRIVEVNGTNISNENHNQVVARIKAGGDETKILVGDRECVDWHREHSTVLHSSLPYTIHLSSEKPKESSSESSEEDTDSEEEDTEEREERAESPAQVVTILDTEPVDSMGETARSPPPPSLPLGDSSSSSGEEEEREEREEEEDSQGSQHSPPSPNQRERTSPIARRTSSVSSSDQEEVSSASSFAKKSTNAQRISYNKDELVAGLNLNMTAAEMRAMVSSRKKKDPRVEKIEMKKKAEMIQNL